MSAERPVLENALATIREREPYRFERTTLANGGELYLQRAPIPFVRLGILFKFGSREDPLGKEGLVHMLEHLLSTKTKGFPSFMSMKKYEEEHGLGVNYGETSLDSCRFSGACLKEDFTYLLHLLSRVISYSCFGEEELTQEKQVVSQELQLKMLPQIRRVCIEMDQKIFGDHPLSRVDNLGEEETIAGLRLGEIKEFAKRYLIPQNAALILIGNFELGEAKTILEKAFVKKLGDLVSDYQPINPPLPSNTRSEYSRAQLGVRGETQTTLRWGFSFSSQELPELCSLVFPLIIRNLEEEFRFKRAWAYGVEHQWQRLRDLAGGYFTISLPPKYETEAEKIFWEGIADTNKRPSTFEACRQRALKVLLATDENYYEVLNHALSSIPIENRIISLEESLKRVASLTFRDFQNFVRKYISPDRTHLAIIRP